ncbi:MAG: prephenate/arogenate dehydrogenase family protein [Pseudomonadota bacterium]
MTSATDFSQVTIVGFGLIGSSIARGLKEADVAGRIVAYDINQHHLDQAKDLDLASDYTTNLSVALSEADFIVMATPVGAANDLLRDVLDHAPEGAVIIDVGSVKEAFANAAQSAATQKHFIVPCHPISGTEQSGPSAGFGNLFRGRWCIITPLKTDTPEYDAAVERVVQFWQALGSMTEIMEAKHHDIALAATSHLPHLIAFTMMGAVDDLESVAESEVIKYSAGGFRDFTRIAASDPVMWRDVFIHNKSAVLEVLGRFTEELVAMQRAIRWGEADTLESAFRRGREIRRAILDAGQEKDVPNFGRDDPE